MGEITDKNGILKLLQNMSEENFWGKLTLHFQNGELKMIKKEATIKVSGLNFSTPGIDNSQKLEV